MKDMQSSIKFVIMTSFAFDESFTTSVLKAVSIMVHCLELAFYRSSLTYQLIFLRPLLLIWNNFSLSRGY